LGPGIYTASKSNNALNFAQFGNSDQNERMRFGKEVLLVCELAYTRNYRKKRYDTMTEEECNIHVTTDATDLIVRGMFLVDPGLSLPVIDVRAAHLLIRIARSS
jgi:hypothetical protein